MLLAEQEMTFASEKKHTAGIHLRCVRKPDEEGGLYHFSNEAAMALADAVGGTQKNFIDLARKEAKKMGITDAEIYTANGLTNGEVKDGKYPGASDTAENKFSAKDMAILSQRLLKDYPEVLETTKIKRSKSGFIFFPYLRIAEKMLFRSIKERVRLKAGFLPFKSM